MPFRSRNAEDKGEKYVQTVTSLEVVNKVVSAAEETAAKNHECEVLPSSLLNYGTLVIRYYDFHLMTLLFRGGLIA